MLTNAELKAEWKRVVKERDEDVRSMGGFFGDDYTLEKKLAIALDDARMAVFFINKLIERLPDDEPMTADGDTHD